MFIDGKLGRKQHEAASASASRLKYNVNLSQNATVKVFYDVCLGPEEEHLFIVHISNPVNFLSVSSLCCHTDRGCYTLTTSLSVDLAVRSVTTKAGPKLIKS